MLFLCCSRVVNIEIHVLCGIKGLFVYTTDVFTTDQMFDTQEVVQHWVI